MYNVYHLGQLKASGLRSANAAAMWVFEHAATDATAPADPLEAAMYLNELQTRFHNPILQDWTIEATWHPKA